MHAPARADVAANCDVLNFDPVKTRYVKVHFNNRVNPNWAPSVYEAEVYHNENLTTGVSDLIVDDCGAADGWYTLQGIKVADSDSTDSENAGIKVSGNPRLAPGIYIHVTGGKPRKVIIR